MLLSSPELERVGALYAAFLGFGLIFGVLGRSVIAALLAGELFLVWVAVRIFLFFDGHRRSGA